MVKTFNEMYEEYEKSNLDDYIVMYFNNEEVYYSQLKRRVEEIMKHLVSFGVKEGTGVGYTLFNRTDIIMLFIAISRLGAYAVPLSTAIPALSRMKSYKNAKVSFIVTNLSMVEELKKSGDEIGYNAEFIVVENQSDYKTIYGDNKEIKDVLKYAVDIHKDDLPLMIGSSSGTTGIPKSVVMTQKNVGSEMIVNIDMQKHHLHKPKQDIRSMAFPFSTSVMLVLCGILLNKSTLVFSDDMSPMNFLKDIEKRKSNSISCPPAYYESLLLLKDKNNYDLSSVLEIGGGMDFFSPSLLKRLKGLFPNLKFFSSGYGLVETCNVYMFTAVNIEGENIENTAEFVLSKEADNIIEVRNEEGHVVNNGDIGEIYVKGPNVVDGYISGPDNAMEAFEDGWFRTGDIACKISDEKVKLIGRRKYFIKRGGKSISPIVVQTEINKTSGIIDSGVVGVPHPLYGEMIWAFVVRDENKDISLRDIKKQCRKTLPYYMIPDQITFIESIPKKTGVGKVDFETLRNMAKKYLEEIGLD